MSLTFVLGLPGTGKTTYCLDDITAKLQDTHHAKLFYIVPEQSSLQAERMLVEKSPGASVMRAEALSFGRLAYHVFARQGGVPRKQLNDTGRHMLLRKILKDLNKEEKLDFYSRAIAMPGFINNLSQTITELSQYSVLPHDLDMRATRYTSQKLKDLATIYRSYKENIAGRFLVASETLDLLADALQEADFKDTLFWVDGFKDFTPQELNVIGRIMTMAKDVVVTLTMDKLPFEGAYPKQSDFFYASKRTLHMISQLAGQFGIKINPPIFLGKMHRQATPCLQDLTLLFPKRNVQSRLAIADTHHIKLICVQDKVAELTQAAKWMVQSVKENRYNFKDIAILCGDLPGYEKLARNIFEPYGIPLFIDSKTGLLSHPFTETIRAVIDISVWDWQYEGVFRLLKAGFSGFCYDEIDRLENYVLARGIKSWRWRTTWQDENMESLRIKVLEAIPTFDAQSTVASFAKSIYDWLYKIDAAGVLAQLVEEDGEYAHYHKQIWIRVAEVFDKFVEILGEDTVTVKTFGEILEEGLKSADMGLIPPTLDQVVMGDIVRSRYPKIKALWVLGANDGQLPPGMGQSSLITEDEREQLHKDGLKLAPDLSRQMSDSMMSLYGALCQPKQELVLSYSKASSDGKLLRPSPIIAKIKKTFPHLQEGQLVSGDGQVVTESNHLNLPLSQNSVNLLYGQDFYTAASRLEAYAACPFAYFLNYNLQAKERAIYQVRAMDLGILYHDVLAQATQQLTKKQAWHTVSRIELEQMINTFAEAVVPGGEDHILRSSARNKYILQRVKSICTVSLWALCEQYKRGAYHTAGVETEAGIIIIPLKQNKNMIVTGRIDRVDVLNCESDKGNDKYIKIIDYKSGNTKFSLEEVQAGNQLQLMLYMNSLLKNSSPGGVFYFNINDPILAVNENMEKDTLEAMLLKEFKMSGLVLADTANINGMDKHLLNRGGDSLIIPVSVKKDGGFGKRSSIASAKEFANLCQGVKEQVKEIGEQMISGDITPKPEVGGKGCKYCKYGAVCMQTL